MEQKIREYYKSLQSFSCIARDGKLISSVKYHEFVQMDLKTGIMQYIDNYYKEDINIKGAVHSFFSMPDDLYYIDGNGRQIAALGKGKRIPLLESKQEISVMFAGKWNEKIVVMYSNGFVFSEIDVMKGTYSFFDLGPALLKKDTNEIDADYIGLDEGVIIIFKRGENRLVCLDIGSNRMTECHYPKELKQVFHTVYREKKIFVLNTDGEIYLWDFKKNTAELMWKSRESGQSLHYGRIHFFKDKVILLPSLRGKDILVFDINFDHETRYDNYSKGFSYNMQDQYKYIRYTESEDEIIYPMRSSYYVMTMNKDSGEINWIQPDRENICDMYKAFIKRHKELYLPEGNIEFDFVDTDVEIKRRLTVGEKIWRYADDLCRS